MLSVWSSVLLTFSSSEHVAISRYIHATLPFCKFTLFCDVVVNSKLSAFLNLYINGILVVTASPTSAHQRHPDDLNVENDGPCLRGT